MTRVEQLTEWVRSKHQGQLIKASERPYFDHLKAVAEMIAETIRFGYEIGLSHDLFEKTQTSIDGFYNSLINFGYNAEEADCIVTTVIELSDVYTKSAYPELKKSVRKEMEEARLALISPDAQTVKYADLIYNVKWMLMYDIEHAENYLKRKLLLLNSMNSGDLKLHANAIDLIEKGLSTFN